MPPASSERSGPEKVAVRLPLLIAAVGLAGSLATILFLSWSASSAVAGVLDARLRGAGEGAAAVLSPTGVGDPALATLMRANALEGAYLLSPDLRVIADAQGARGTRADLLRVDPARVKRAFAGESSVERSYTIGEVAVTSGYFPVREEGSIVAVLGLEAGAAFSTELGRLHRAMAIGALLALAAAVALYLVGSAALAGERHRRQVAVEAARREALGALAAMAAHEIRNPLTIIQGTVELLRSRLREKLMPRDEEALSDITGEVARLNQLTRDFVDLSSDRALELGEVDLDLVLAAAADPLQLSHPRLRVSRERLGARVCADAGRLRQVFANLLANAAEAAGTAEVRIRGEQDAGWLRIHIEDDGPGVPEPVRARLFEPFVTGKRNGTGLGLSLSRKIVERHGGTLALVPSEAGAHFVVTLPRPMAQDGADGVRTGGG